MEWSTLTQQLYSYFGKYICLVLDNLPLTHALSSSQFYISSLNPTPSYLIPHSYVHPLNHFVPQSSLQFSLPPLIPTLIPSFPSIPLPHLLTTSPGKLVPEVARWSSASRESSFGSNTSPGAGRYASSPLQGDITHMLYEHTH